MLAGDESSWGGETLGRQEEKASLKELLLPS